MAEDKQVSRLDRLKQMERKYRDKGLATAADRTLARIREIEGSTTTEDE